MRHDTTIGVRGRDGELAVGRARLDPWPLLDVAIVEARASLAEGGVPIGAALFSPDGTLLGAGHNRQVQATDLTVHAEVDAFRRAGVQRTYRDKILVTTLAPCWFCSGLVRHFGIGTLVIGESTNFACAGLNGLLSDGTDVVDLRSDECLRMLAEFIRSRPDVWMEGRHDDEARGTKEATDSSTRVPMPASGVGRAIQPHEGRNDGH